MNSTGFVLEAVVLLLVVLMYKVVTSTLSVFAKTLAGQAGAAVPDTTYPLRPFKVRFRVAQLLAGISVCVITALMVWHGSYAPIYVEFLTTPFLAILLWRGLCQGYSPFRTVTAQRIDRAACAGLAMVAFLWPAVGFVALIALCGRLGSWNHHTHVTIRALKVTYSVWITAGLLSMANLGDPLIIADLAFVFVSAMFFSHYIVAGISKMRVGYRWTSWATRNDLRFLVAAARTWGWGRQFKNNTWATLVSVVGFSTLEINVITLLVELIGLISLADRLIFIFSIVCILLFSLSVLITSGICFWENMVVGIVLLSVAAFGTTSKLFGVGPLCMSLVIYALVAANCVWRPNKLGWFDSPLTERVTFAATTVLGAKAVLPPALFSPAERHFSREAGLAYVDKKVLTFPLGGVEDQALLDRLSFERLDAADLRNLRSEFGRKVRSEGVQQTTADYVSACVAKVNGGEAPKRFIPFRPPQSHYYNRSAMPTYRRSLGAIVRVDLIYEVKAFLPGEMDWKLLEESIVHTIYPRVLE